MKSKIILTILTLIFISSFIAASEQTRSPENIVLEGGRMGKVSFPHHIHHNIIGDCNYCHNLFPKVSNSIEKLKAEGKLEKKEIMNYCRDCHQTKAKNKEKAGPTSCKECHQK